MVRNDRIAMICTSRHVALLRHLFMLSAWLFMCPCAGDGTIDFTEFVQMMQGRGSVRWALYTHAVHDQLHLFCKQLAS